MGQDLLTRTDEQDMEPRRQQRRATDTTIDGGHTTRGTYRCQPLEEALRQPCKHRDMALALEPMHDFSSTPGGPHGQPLAFWAAWGLEDRPRRIALLVDDCQEEYRPYAADILPNIIALVDTFRAVRSRHEGVCIAWSAWSRAFDDGISNAMDRLYGPRGLRPEVKS